MPIPASLIASIVSAILEAASQNIASTPKYSSYYENYVANRKLPPEAKLGVMLPPEANGELIIDGKTFPLSAVAQFRSPQNLIVMPMTIQERKNVVYITDANGAIFRVWMLSPTELQAIQSN